MKSLRRLVRRASSIRVRLTLWYVALLAVILVAFSGVLYVSLSRSLSQELDLTLSTEATRLVASAGGLFLAARALDPIDRITRAAAAIGAEDLSRRLNFRTRDEVGRLAATFDRMLDRLERAFGRQRQFTADASHELRTPL